MTSEQFCNMMYGYAVTAGKALNISPIVVLSQWGLETGWGTNNGFLNHHNLAGLNSTNGVAQTFSNFMEAVRQYVVNMKADCPHINDGTANPESDALFVLQGTDYNANPQYPTDVQQVYTDNVLPWWHDSVKPTNTHTVSTDAGEVTFTWDFATVPYHIDVSIMPKK
jgi:hypothetical protein